MSHAVAEAKRGPCIRVRMMKSKDPRIVDAKMRFVGLCIKNYVVIV